MLYLCACTVMHSIYPRANLVTKSYDGCAMRVVFSKLQNLTALISATVTLEMAVVHSNTWVIKLRKHVNHMWPSLYAESPDRFGLLPADDDELWQLTVVHTVTTDMMRSARVGRVCMWCVDQPVVSGAHYELSSKSKHDRTCAASGRV